MPDAHPRLSGLARRLFDRALKPPYVAIRAAVIHQLFERSSGIEARPVALAELGLAHEHRVDHVPSFWRTLRRILPEREVTGEDVFLDLGSGMGRAVFLAARDYAFRRVIGVEIAAPLHEIARRNLARNRHRLRCRDVELVNADVLAYRIPDDVTVVYLYNPFRGPVFAHVVDELCRSLDRRPRPLRVIYLNPVEEASLLASGRGRLLRAVRGWRPTRDWARANAIRMYALT